MSKNAKPAFRCRQIPRAKRTINKFKNCRKIINNIFLGNTQLFNVNNNNTNQYNFYKCESEPSTTIASKIKPIENKSVLEFGSQNAEKKVVLKSMIPKSETFKMKTTSKLSRKISLSDTSLCDKENLEKITFSNLPPKKILLIQGKRQYTSFDICKPILTENNSNIQRTLMTEVKDDVNIISSKLKMIDFKGTTGLENKILPIKNNSADILCKLGHIVRNNEPSKLSSGKIVKHILNFRNDSVYFNKQNGKSANGSTETSTPKKCIISKEAPTKRNWEVSPIKTKLPLEQSDETNDETILSLEISESKKIDCSADIFELTRYFDASRLESTVDTEAENELLNCTHNQDSFHAKQNEIQKNDSLLETRSYRTSRSKESWISFPDIQQRENSLLSHSYITIGDLGNETQNMELFDSELKANRNIGRRNSFNTFDSIKNDSLCYSFDECCETSFEETSENNSKMSDVSSYKNLERFAAAKEQYTNIIPGKKWRRSLLTAGNRKTICSSYKHDFNNTKCSWNIRLSLNPQGNLEFIKSLQKKNTNPLHDITEQHTPGSDKNIITNEYNSIVHDSYFEDEDDGFDCTLAIHRQVTNILQSDETLVSYLKHQKRLADDMVLDLCNQKSHIHFNEYVDGMRQCQKIGEGIYGEVFSFSTRKQQTVLKVIPIEGDLFVNSSQQKTYNEVFSEMCVALSLSNLKNFLDGNYTDGFCSILNIVCLKGKYPEKLIKEWNEYDKRIGSENDAPTIFGSDQLYVALEMLPGGEPLESYQFCSSRQSYSILLQVMHALAVAESAFEFEHRDLHWGNVLISKTNLKNVKYMIKGQTFNITTYGRKSTIIDYTLSRIRSGKFDIYNDLENEADIFQAYGDYQFDIYREMRKDVHKKWESFVPKTNVRWVHYLVTKCYDGVYYKTDHKIHKTYLDKIRVLRDKILSFDSVYDLVKSLV